MLNIWYRGGDIEVLRDAQMYFKYNWKPDWIIDPFVKEMIKDVDKSEVIGPHLIESPVLGPIPPERLSGGIQVLILMLKDDSFIYNLSNCGDNCAKWALEIGEKKNITVYLHHIMDFKGDYELKIMNTGKIVKPGIEYIKEIFKADDLVESGKISPVTFI